MRRRAGQHSWLTTTLPHSGTATCPATFRATPGGDLDPNIVTHWRTGLLAMSSFYVDPLEEGP